MANYLTRDEIRTRVLRAIKMSNTSAKSDLADDAIEQAYREMLNSDVLYPLYWMVDFDDTLFTAAPSTITAINITTDKLTVQAHGLTTSDIIQIYNVVGTTELNNRMFRITATADANTIALADMDGTALDLSALAYTAYVSGGTVHHRGRVLNTTSRPVKKLLQVAVVDELPMERVDFLGLERDKNCRSFSPEYMDESTSKPRFYAHQKKYLTTGSELDYLLWFWSSDAKYRLRYWIEKRADILAASSVPQIPYEFHPAIAAGAIARLNESGVEVENPPIWAAIYQAGLQQLLSYNRDLWQHNSSDFEPTAYLL